MAGIAPKVMTVGILAGFSIAGLAYAAYANRQATPVQAERQMTPERPLVSQSSLISTPRF